MGTIVRPALMLLVLMTLLTGVAYPLLVTGLAQLFFHPQAQGSLIVHEGRAIGSHLIGQNFSDPKYFWGRPSATSPQPYNGLASGSSNLGPLNPALIAAVKSRIEVLRAADPNNHAPVPVDLVTASASGLDPEISLAAAQYQAARVARARGIAPQEVEKLIAAHSMGPLWGFLGEPRVNVLDLNLALDARR